MDKEKRTAMLAYCIDIDQQNIPLNGFTNIHQIDDFYKDVSDEQLLKIFEEYSGEKDIK